MKYLASFAGDDAVHITLCSAMGNQLTQIYPSVREVVPLSNVFLMPSKFLGESAGGESLVLGHISNLTFDKGLRTCVELVRELRKYRRDVKLVIAGPCATADVAAYVEDTVRDNPDFITYLGPVYHERKEQFFAGLDLFVFPTKYRNEAQPLVILEALSHGIPVAAYATACAASDLSGSGCCAVCPSTSFVESALPWILESFATVEAAQRAREAACDQFRLLQAINSGHIDTFISELKTGHNPKGTRNKAHG
ncbi:MAG: glycosyltransferase family 4 protein [Pseudomonadota bacterium]